VHIHSRGLAVFESLLQRELLYSQPLSYAGLLLLLQPSPSVAFSSDACTFAPTEPGMSITPTTLIRPAQIPQLSRLWNYSSSFLLDHSELGPALGVGEIDVGGGAEELDHDREMPLLNCEACIT
jgi:hypothetical protein